MDVFGDDRKLEASRDDRKVDASGDEGKVGVFGDDGNVEMLGVTAKVLRQRCESSNMSAHEIPLPVATRQIQLGPSRPQ